MFQLFHNRSKLLPLTIEYHTKLLSLNYRQHIPNARRSLLPVLLLHTFLCLLMRIKPDQDDTQCCTVRAIDLRFKRHNRSVRREMAPYALIGR